MRKGPNPDSRDMSFLLPATGRIFTAMAQDLGSKHSKPFQGLGFRV